MDDNNIKQGFVYVLTNPCMPGLVKIGMTTNEPEQRVKELSSATGVPVPFTLVYYRKFNDCRAAESEIHQKLSDKGFRYNTNREFFEMNTTDAINAVMEVEDTEIKHTIQNEENASLLKAEELYNKAFWTEMQAIGHIMNKEACRKNKEAALEMYKQAEELGCKKALVRMPNCFSYDNEGYIRESHTAARKGASQCYLNIARRTIDIAEQEGRLLSNSEKNKIFQSLDLFIRKIEFAYNIDIQSCLNATKLYIFISLGFHKQVDENRLRPIVKRLRAECEDDIKELYDYMSDGIDYFGDATDLLEDEAENMMKKLIGIN